LQAAFESKNAGAKKRWRFFFEFSLRFFFDANGSAVPQISTQIVRKCRIRNARKLLN
jgi:hypothetical protein